LIAAARVRDSKATSPLPPANSEGNIFDRVTPDALRPRLAAQLSHKEVEDYFETLCDSDVATLKYLVRCSVTSVPSPVIPLG